jgi:hypothetical protein
VLPQLWFGFSSRLLLVCLGLSFGSAFPMYSLEIFVRGWCLGWPVGSGLSLVGSIVDSLVGSLVV